MSLKWPDPMPEGGRLPESKAAYTSGRMLVTDPQMSCPQTLHITLFFDGTNNNDDESNKIWRDSKVKAHTNVARLFNAAVHKDKQGIFAFYLPGVGTPFPKIGEDAYTTDGKAFASGFDSRCVWGYTRLLNAVYSAIASDNTKELIPDKPDARNLCDASGPVAAFKPYLNRLGVAHKQAVDESRYPQTVKKIWINVIGFSRGAAGARAFVHKLVNEWAPGGKLGDQTGKYALPYEVNFMGLFDTVASVSLPDSSRPIFNLARIAGHSSLHWLPGMGGRQTAFAGDGAMNIPDQVRYCYHAFSIHEQRMSFPLDSIRRGKSYPGGCRIEIAYPGVHSDVGGGYGPGEQGKACDSNGHGVDARKLSQIPLHDMYIAALKCGVPLMTGDEIQNTPRVAPDFAIDPATIKTFNAWLKSADPVSSLDDAMKFGMGQLLTWRMLRAQIGTGDYVTQRRFYQIAKEDSKTPHQITDAVEKAKKTDPQYRSLSQQLAQAKVNQLSLTPSFTPGGLVSQSYLSDVNKVKTQINDAQAKQTARADALTGEIGHPNAKPDPTGRPNAGRPGDAIGDFVTRDRTDLRQGAEEMRLLLGYLYPAQRQRWQVAPNPGMAANPFTGPDLPHVDREGPCESPRLQMAARAYVWQCAVSALTKFDLTDDVLLKPVQDDAARQFWLKNTSDAALKKLQTQPDVITLFDDYAHDSRCWFRVPWFHEYAPGGYFWPRVVFVGNDDRTPWLGFDPQEVALNMNSETGAGATEIA